MNTTSKAALKHNTQNVGHILNASGCRGMIFSLDAMISFTIMLSGVLLFVLALNNYATNAEQNIKNFELEEKALLIADSFVKNFDENNTLRGACVYDPEKKRVRANELNLENIKNAKELVLGKIFTKSVEYKTQTNSRKVTLSQKDSANCVSAKRFVLIEGEKGIIQILTCREG